MTKPPEQAGSEKVAFAEHDGACWRAEEARCQDQIQTFELCTWCSGWRSGVEQKHSLVFSMSACTYVWFCTWNRIFFFRLCIIAPDDLLWFLLDPCHWSILVTAVLLFRLCNYFLHVSSICIKCLYLYEWQIFSLLTEIKQISEFNLLNVSG